jgi:cytochrome P450
MSGTVRSPDRKHATLEGFMREHDERVDVDADSRLVALAEQRFIDLDPKDPQSFFHQTLQRRRYIRDSEGLTLFRMADIGDIARSRDVLGAGASPELAPMAGGRRMMPPVDLDGPDHTRYRRILDPLFSPREVAKLEPTIAAIADELIDRFIDDDSVEVVSRYCGPVAADSFLALLGLPTDLADFFVRFKEAAMRPEGSTRAERKKNARAAGDEMYAFLYSFLEENDRRATLRPGSIIGRLLKVEADGVRLNRDGVVDIIYVLTIAGFDTVTSTLSLIFAWLVDNPKHLAELVADPAIIGSAVEEMLRFHSPVPVTHRTPTRDMTINGLEFQANERVQLAWAAANLDPEEFTDPLNVDLARAPNRHMAFAVGVHRCLGAHLARMELRVALARFVARVPHFSLEPGGEIEYTSHTVRAVTRLPLRLRP